MAVSRSTHRSTRARGRPGAPAGPPRRVGARGPRPRAGWTRGDIAGEQFDGGQPTGMAQPRQGRCQGGADAQSDRGVQGRGDHGIQAGPIDHVQGACHATERLRLDDHDVGGPGPGDGHRIVGAAHRLVRRDGHGDASAHPGEFLDAGAGLFHVLKALCCCVELDHRSHCPPTDQAALASTRMRPSGPSSARAAATLAQSGAGQIPGRPPSPSRSCNHRWPRSAAAPGSVRPPGSSH